MSNINVSLRLSGEPPSGKLPSEIKLTEILGCQPTKVLRKGEQRTKTITQPIDVCILDLANIEDTWTCTQKEIDHEIEKVTTHLQKISKNVSSLDRKTCRADLYISTIREEDQGGLSLPPELITAAAAANLSLQISILVMLKNNE